MSGIRDLDAAWHRCLALVLFTLYICFFFFFLASLFLPFSLSLFRFFKYCFIQYNFVLVSGVQHSGETVIYFAQCSRLGLLKEPGFKAEMDELEIITD